MQSDSWLPQKTEVSHYLKIYANKGRAKIEGNNYLPEKLELQPFMNCTMGHVDDVYLNSIRGVWSGEGFHVQSVTNKRGPKKALSSSTLAHQKERKLILQDDQNKQNSHLRCPPQLTVLLGVSTGRFLPAPLASESLQTHGGGGRGLKHRCPASCQAPDPKGWQQA